VVFQGLDLRGHTAPLSEHRLVGATFLGCRLERSLLDHALSSGALVFPEIPNLPYHPYRGGLYSVPELYDRFDAARPESYRDCLDARVYAHWKESGGAAPTSILETLARRLHDHAISDAVEELVTPARVVAIMGGHSMPRSAPSYLAAARIARELAQKGFLMASGGGPGAMEATHVGAWFASASDDDLAAAVAHLARAPRYDDEAWLSRAFEVRAAHPASPPTSLGIPTWLYGHEPPNAFASHVAKYFANSVREDGLLTIARHGIVFTPGSAGTIQEIFQDACQNHYVTAGVVSPMIFFGVRYWTEDKPVYPLLARLAEGRPYAEWLAITDDPEEVVDLLVRYESAHP
jgi:predicted Rossmann-fold nucleotide-binding protein